MVWTTLTFHLKHKHGFTSNSVHFLRKHTPFRFLTSIIFKKGTSMKHISQTQTPRKIWTAKDWVCHKSICKNEVYWSTPQSEIYLKNITNYVLLWSICSCTRTSSFTRTPDHCVLAHLVSMYRTKSSLERSNDSNINTHTALLKDNFARLFRNILWSSTESINSSNDLIIFCYSSINFSTQLMYQYYTTLLQHFVKQ